MCGCVCLLGVRAERAFINPSVFLFLVFAVFLFLVKDPKKNGEWEVYFRDMPTALSSLLVLLTTANNPDGAQSTSVLKFGRIE